MFSGIPLFRQAASNDTTISVITIVARKRAVHALQRAMLYRRAVICARKSSAAARVIISLRACLAHKARENDLSPCGGNADLPAILIAKRFRRGAMSDLEYDRR